MSMMPAANGPAATAVGVDVLQKEIRNLSSDELIVRLMTHGIKPGPITGTTRPLFERKLLRILTGDSEPQDTAEKTKQSAENTSEPVKAAESDSTPSKDALFFGVQIPVEARANESTLVFQDKKEALRLVKSYPGSRFKAFAHRGEASVFSQQNPEQVPPSPKPIKPDGKPVTEGSAFRGPKPQELVRLRKAIEAGDKETVLKLAWTNPRYLISSGDTPTVLQEGFRYNALHVCGQKNQAEICQAILDTLQDANFMKLLYPDDPSDTRQDRINFITDLYLNTPDKGNNETPLHFACKFAFPDVVQVLMNHPKTDKHRRNRYNETAATVACSRARNPSQDLKDKILQLLQDQCYVPLLRSDNEWHVAPEPWTPEKLSEARDTTASITTTPQRPPTNSPLQVKAVAGPMSPVLAEQFRKEWVTPPSPRTTDRRRIAEIKRSDYEKGIERIGRMVAKKMNISWVEYWKFLDAFIDLTTPDGLTKLENYLRIQAQKLDSPVSTLEQQFAQLNLSDSGEDSGIENRDQHTPPLAKRTPHKQLLSARSPLPTISLYMKKPPASTPQLSPPNPSDMNKDSSDKTSPIKRAAQSEPELGTAAEDPAITSPPESAETTLQGDSSAVSSGSVTPSVTETSPLREASAAARLSETPAEKSVDVTDLSKAVNLKEVKKALDEVEGEVRGRVRRASASSVASSTSDISTDSYHTCFEDVFVDMDSSDDDDFKDLNDELDDLEITSPWKHSYFINGCQPSKDDVDVLRAIETTPVSPDDYPHVSKWRDALLSYSEEDRNRFQSPTRGNRSASAHRVSSEHRTLSRPRTPSAPALAKADLSKKDLYQSFLEA